MRFEEKYMKRRKFNFLPFGIYLLRAAAVVLAFAGIEKFLKSQMAGLPILVLAFVCIFAFQVIAEKLLLYLGFTPYHSRRELALQGCVVLFLVVVFLL